MQHEYWENKWETNDIRFHLPEVNPLLIHSFTALPTAKVFVPLCGKSIDMCWLISQGHTVIGVELSSIACKAFFIENNLSFSILDKKPFKVYKGKNIEIWCGDIFQLPPDAYANINAIYDRAALIALPDEIRSSYIKFIKNLLNASSHIDILLITMEYPQDKVEGPPFSITNELVQTYYSPEFTIKQLQLPDDYISVFKHNPKFKGVLVREDVYWLSSK